MAKKQQPKKNENWIIIDRPRLERTTLHDPTRSLRPKLQSWEIPTNWEKPERRKPEKT